MNHMQYPSQQPYAPPYPYGSIQPIIGGSRTTNGLAISAMSLSIVSGILLLINSGLFILALAPYFQVNATGLFQTLEAMDTSNLALATFLLQFISGLLAVILGFVGVHQIQHSTTAQKGNGLAITAIVLGGIAFVSLPIMFITSFFITVSRL